MTDKKCINLFCRPWVLAIVYFVIALSVRYHGFSLGYWENLVNPTSAVTLLGESQGVRSDDFFVGLPLAFSQIQSGFHATNPLLGFGQNNLVTSYQVPILHWTVIFKPLTWGYFLGPDIGMSWHWNLNVVLLFVAIYTFLSSFATFDKKTTFWLTVGTFFSSFFQFWSYIGAPYFYWPLFMVLTLKKTQEISSAKIKFLLATLFVWSLGNLTYTIYPPFQLFGLYFISIFSLFYLIKSQNKKTLVLIYFATAILVSLTLLKWYSEVKEIIKIVSSTHYPGRRFTTGGDGTWLRLFQNNLFLKDAFREDPVFGGNISEGSGFWSLFIPLTGLIAFQWRKISSDLKLLLQLSIGFILLFACWYLVGLPAPLALITGIAQSVEKRAVLFVAFINLIFLISCGSILQDRTRLDSKILKGLFFAWSTLQIYFAFKYCPRSQGAIAGTVVMTSLHLFSMWSLFQGQIPRFAKIWGLTMFLATASFNPVVFGGYERLFVHSELAKEVHLTDPNKDQVWLVDNDVVLSSLPRALGLKSFGGPTFYPQQKFWQTVDEKGAFENTWNRYAALVLKVSAQNEVQIHLPYFDRVEVDIPKDSDLFKKLGITRILQVKSHKENVTPLDFKILTETSCCLIWGATSR